MKRFLAGFAAAVVLVAAGALVFLTRGGLSARVEPSWLEARAARAVRKAAIPSAFRDRSNPLPASARILAEARAHFADHCASCHGNDGRGQTELGRNLYPRPPDLRAEATQSLSDGELFYVIEDGIRFTGMPAWGGAGKPEESWKLVHFIRHLPRLTDEERVEMERINPRSAGEWRELEEEDQFLRGGDAPPAPGGHHH
jgi:mono/diheme cytochrome c family protein